MNHQVVFRALVSSMSDQSLEHRVRACLESARYAVFDNVIVSADGGAVTLTGRVTTFHTKQLAQELVRRVPGVIHVVNLVEVRNESTL